MSLRYPALLLLIALAAPLALAQDLSITASAEDASGEAGDRVQTTYTVTLTGAEEIEDISVGFYFSTDQTLSPDDAFSEREEVDAESDEAESDDEQIDIPSSLSDGDYFILVVIDDQEQVSETDETNNTAAIPFTVGGGTGGGGGGADLRIVSASAPSSAAAGDEIEVSYTLGNDGSEQAGPSQVAVYVSTNRTLSSNDVLAGRTEADEVDAGDSGDEDEGVTVPNSLAPGDYFLLFVADDRNAVTETDESNNTFALAFTVTGSGGGTGGSGQADLEVTQASVAPPSAPAGGQVQVNYTLANTGTEQAGNSRTAFYVSTDRSFSSGDVLAGTTDTDEVDAGGGGDEDEDLTIPSGLAPGDYFLLVVADSGNDVAERAENNNVAAVPFTVEMGTATDDAPHAGLSLAAPAPNPVREQTTLRYTLVQGGTVHLAVYDALGRRVTTLADGPRTAGAHDATWTPAAVASGVYVVRLAVDGAVVTRRVSVVR